MNSLSVGLLGLTLMNLSACASNNAAPPEQARARDVWQKCAAASFDRDKCAQYANQRCAAGFEVTERDAAEEDGVVRRGLYYRCLF